MKLPLAAALALAAFVLMPAPSQAATDAAGVEPPAAWAQGRCAVRRERIVRPNGRVVVRTVRNCRPARVERCRVERQRVVRPNGRVVVRTVRTCR
ncbi:MAG TPA: hypothetical protein VEA41_02335 [Salinarimonas sp.]|nr:hypothetical protein [Salinarimonas sp.]